MREIPQREVRMIRSAGLVAAPVWKRALGPAIALAAAACSPDTPRSADTASPGDSAAAAASVGMPGFAIAVEAGVIGVGGARFTEPGAERSRIDLVPLRTDHSEWAALVRLDGRALVLRPRGEEVQVLWAEGPPPRTPYLYRSNALWLLDVDGDGDHELVREETAHTDVGPEPAGRTVMRLDRSAGRFVDATRELAAATPYGRGAGARREPRGLRTALGVRGAAPEVWSEADLVLLVRDPEGVDRGGEGITFAAGAEVAQLVYARPTTDALAGEAFVVVTRVVGPRVALAWRSLGPVILRGAAACPERLADRSGVRILPIAGKPGFAILATWMSDSLTLAGTVLGWDGAALAAPPDPVVLLRCGGAPAAAAALDAVMTPDGRLVPHARAPR